MADLYYDYLNGADVNPGTKASPKKDFCAVALAANNNYFVRRGVSFPRPAGATGINNGISAANIKIQAYGEATTPYAFLPQTEATRPGLYILGSATNAELGGLHFVTVNHAGLSVIDSSGNAPDGVTVKNCYFSNPGTTENGVSIKIFTATAITSNVPRNILLEDCIAEACGQHGFFVGRSALNVRYSRCIARGNGVAIGSHGFSSWLYATSISNSVWTQVGSVYWASYTTQPMVGATAVNLSSAYTWLTQNFSTPLTPALNEFGYDPVAQRIYINTGYDVRNLAGFTLEVADGNIFGLVYENCLAEDTVDFNGGEGIGFAADDFTSHAKFLNCVSRNNQGQGFHNNRGGMNEYIGVSAYENGKSGIFLNGSAPGVRVEDSLFADNYTNTGLIGSFSGEIECSRLLGASIRRNQVACRSAVPYGIFASASSTGTVDRNAITGYGTSRVASVSGLTETNSVYNSQFGTGFGSGRTKYFLENKNWRYTRFGRR